MITVHRKEQYDIIEGGIKTPLVVVGWARPGEYKRLFCLWVGGIWFRLPKQKRFSFVWSSK